MHVTIDNIFAFLILILIIVTFMGYIIPSAYLSFTTVREHQLEEIAQSIMDKILLSPGVPENWGNVQVVGSENSLRAFGLQKAYGEPYELDVDKVLRIVSVNTSTTRTLPSYVRISPDVMARLLGLGIDYGFSIRITPALNISVKTVGYYTFKNGRGVGHGQLTVPCRLEVTVATPDGRPALGANVTGLFIFMSVRGGAGKDFCYVNSSYLPPQKTDWRGETMLDFTPLLSSIDNELMNKVLRKSCSSIVIYADYYGIKAVNSSLLATDADNILGGTVVDNYLVLEHEAGEELEFLAPPAAIHLSKEVALANPPYYVYLSDFEDVTRGESGQILNNGRFNIRVYELANVVDDDVSLILMPIKYRGSFLLACFFRAPSNVICQRGAVSGNIKTSVLERVVRIGSFHYIVEVRVWRWAEG
ncbi:MAG: hypothetical protein FGF52_00835 [Candidatus Brockarchaeota archaeon]|nr:hypothetical protein [Candidatus Brockarchaeota archaeon]